MSIGVFVAYWPCGNCICAAYTDGPMCSPDLGSMLIEAVREKRKVGYIAAGDPHPELVWECRCSVSAKESP